MSFLFWLAALFLFVVWSMVAWLLFAGSDWIAGILATAFGGLLSAELGPWAQWLSTGLGDIVQVVVGLTWAIVGLAILSAPVWAGRLLARRERYVGGDRRVAVVGDAPGYQHRWSDDGWKQKGWRDRDAWKGRYERGRHELDELRHMASDMVGKYRKKKKKKWDDD